MTDSESIDTMNLILFTNKVVSNLSDYLETQKPTGELLATCDQLLALFAYLSSSGPSPKDLAQVSGLLPSQHNAKQLIVFATSQPGRGGGTPLAKLLEPLVQDVTVVKDAEKDAGRAKAAAHRLISFFDGVGNSAASGLATAF